MGHATVAVGDVIRKPLYKIHLVSYPEDNGTKGKQCHQGSGEMFTEYTWEFYLVLFLFWDLPIVKIQSSVVHQMALVSSARELWLQYF